MNTTTNKLVDTIRKLLAKADPTRGATPAEAQAAMAKAQELMTKHGIEAVHIAQAAAADAKAAKPFTINHESVVMDRSRRYDFDNNVGRILIKCFGVHVVWTNTYTATKMCHTYMLIGDELDIAMAKMALPILLAAMKEGVATYLKEQLGGAAWTASVGRAFYDGMEHGYCHGSAQGRARACEQAKKADADAYAIVMVDKDKAIVDYKDHLFPKLRKTKDQRRSSRDEHAYRTGYEKGTRLDISSNKLK